MTTSSLSIRVAARLLCFALALNLFIGATNLLAQTPAQKSSAQTAKKNNPPDEAVANSSESPNVLLQLNGALEDLAARVSPAVVQILVTGFGPLHEESDKSQTSYIVRQHAVGSGV